MSSLVSFREIQAAANRLSGIALRTPLVPLRIGKDQVLVKAESLQPTGAFKLERKRGKKISKKREEK